MIDWPFSTRLDVRFVLWELMVRVKHRFGRHTFIDVEDWSKEAGFDVITIVGQECWCCRART